MINIITWLEDNSYAEDLSAFCAGENIRIAANIFAGTEDFLQKFDELDVNIDVMVVCDSVLQVADKRSFFDNVRAIEPNIRIVIMFPGYRNQYIEDQITEYKNLYGVSDIIYEGRGLDMDYFAEVVKKGYIYDYDLNVFDEQEEAIRPAIKKTDCVTVGVMGLTSGAGVTNMVISAAEYISMSENLPVRAVDLSGTGNLRFTAKNKKITYIVHPNIDFDRLKKASRAVVIDFGAPYNISPKGRLISRNGCYSEDKIALMRSCDLKIFMCLSDDWHSGKLKYLLNERSWKKAINGSCLFLVDNAEKIQGRYPKIEIYGRNEQVIPDSLSRLFAAEGGD